MLLKVVILAFLCAMTYAQSCSATTCQACFLESGCGWCVTDGTCLPGSSRGPTATGTCRGVVGNGGSQDREYWYYSASQVLSTSQGFPVNPSVATIYLKPSDPVSLPVQVTSPLPTDQDLDLMFVQDTSGSMAPYIQTFRVLATSLVNAVLKLSRTAQTGLASFIEKPVFPQGFPPGDPKYQLADGSIRNFAYRLETPLGQSSLVLERALYNLDATSNRDLPESSFDALSQVLTCPNIGWRPQARKVVVVCSDAKYHCSNDPASWVTNGNVDSPPWDGTCYGTQVGVKYTRENTNYPSEQQIGNLFKSTNIIPIFAIAHNVNDPDPETEIEYWTTFQQNYIGFGAVLPLSPNADNLIDLIVTALSQINQAVTLLVSSDPSQTVNTVTDASGHGSLGNWPSYSGVQPGQTVNFNVGFLSSNPPASAQVTLTSPGFGSVAVTVTNVFPCNDCNGVANGAATWDKCDECAGSNRCVGCDMVANSGKVIDSCGVCGGSNQCMVTCASGATDMCGVCNGQNQCLGCDGVPNSNAVYDTCGVCGGLNACISCDNVPYGSMKLDMCGVCGGSNQCVGCDGVAHAGTAADPVPVVDDCGVCGGTSACECDPSDKTKNRDLCGNCLHPTDQMYNSCVGCDGQPMSGLIYDACGVCNGQNACVSDCDGKPYGVLRDVCGICGGTGDCVNFEAANITLLSKVVKDKSTGLATGSATLIGVAVAVPVALLVCAAVVAAFFIYKRMKNPYWMVPEGLLNNLNAGVADNPLYAGNSKWANNAIAE